jgi:trk system potassium uptake protein TrkA
MGENFSQSILITALLKKNINISKKPLSAQIVVARAISKIHENILRLVGADRIVFPERDLGIKVANNLSFSLAEFVQVSETFAITEIKPPQNFIGKTVSDLQLRKSRKVNCFAVKQEEEIILISSDYVISENDKLLLAGTNENLADIVEEIS